MKQRTFAKAFAILSIVALLSTSCSKTPFPSFDSLLGALASSPELASALGLIEAAGGLGAILGPLGGGKSTLFLPNNDAIEDLGEDMIGKLTDPANLTLLTNTLRGHAVSGALTPSKVAKEGSLTNAMGKSLSVSGTEDNLMVGGANVVKTLETKEGFIHVIDGIIKN